jgi:SPP1 gp7 family putative phage head morphogenesis protein
LIAVNETTKIFDEGNLLAHVSGGINEEEWQTVRDARVDDICRPLDGQRFPINAGPRPVTGTHIGCRCARLPVGPGGDVLGR